MPGPTDPKIQRPGFFAAGMLLQILVAACFLLPIWFPQPVCGAFGDWMACRDGAAARCANVPKPRAGRNQQELVATCRAGERVSTTPILVVSGAAASVVGALGLGLILKGLQKPPGGT